VLCKDLGAPCGSKMVCDNDNVCRGQVGASCTHSNGQYCLSGTCTNGACAPVALGGTCVNTTDCESLANCFDYVYNNKWGMCIGTTGAACSNGTYCASWICTKGACTSVPLGQACVYTTDCGSLATCVGYINVTTLGTCIGSNGADCSSGTACPSGICVNNTCVKVSPGGGCDIAADCSGNAACQSGICVLIALGTSCTDASDCSSNAHCFSGNCYGVPGANCKGGKWCMSGSCAGGECFASTWGQACVASMDCVKGLSCSNGTSICEGS